MTDTLPSTLNAVLVGGTAAALHANHRRSQDADHVVPDLKQHFTTVLQQLEAVAGWQTARVQRPVQILGSLDGIETGVRQQIRQRPLETMQLTYDGLPLTVPTPAEILRIKGLLIVTRNATRDYVDFVALADHLGSAETARALCSFDRYYPQDSGQSALQQLQAQLATPLPYDLHQTNLTAYKNLDHRWHDWNTLSTACANIATNLFDHVCEAGTDT